MIGSYLDLSCQRAGAIGSWESTGDIGPRGWGRAYWGARRVDSRMAAPRCNSGETVKTVEKAFWHWHTPMNRGVNEIPGRFFNAPWGARLILN